MVRICLIAMAAGVAWAQSPADAFNRPPARVDKELRARINEFYQDHVKQEFRKADALVAQDTKNFFYTQNKPAYLGCEVARIEYSENFTRAKATVVCEQYFMLPGFADKPVKVPIPSTWKIERGKWYWYVDQEALRQSPFGKMTPGPGGHTGSLPASIPQNADFVLKLVTADKQTVELKPGESQQVTITNSAPGNMDLTIAGAIPGIEATLDHSQMKIGDRAVLTLKAGDRPQSGLFSIRVEQTGLVIPIQVVVPHP
jgi:hypothetical protein